MHLKTTMRYHLTPVRTAFIIKKQIINAGEDVGKRETAYPDEEKKIKQNSITVVLENRKRCY